LRPVDEQGYVILAINSDKVDYLNCARTLTKTIKHWDPSAKVCLITDAKQSNDPIYDHYRVIENVDLENPWANDWRVFKNTPFRETVKLEADMMIVSDISHWWDLFRHRDVVVSTGCRNWQNQVSTARNYRQVFDHNHLPDVYNAADTDLVYAMAAEIMGRERVTLPFVYYPKITHMKRHIAGTQTENWMKELVWEYSNCELRVNTVAQWGAFHFNVKDWRA